MQPASRRVRSGNLGGGGEGRKRVRQEAVGGGWAGQTIVSGGDLTLTLSDRSTNRRRAGDTRTEIDEIE